MRRVDDPNVQSAPAYVHFNPALDKGKPVDGVAVMKIGQPVTSGRET